MPASRARDSAIAPAASLPAPSRTRLAGAPLAPAVASWVASLLREVVLPAGWISAPAASPSIRDGDEPLRDDDDAARTLGATSVWDLDPADALSTTANDDPESAALRAAFGRMIVGARSRKTLSAYRNPYLKLVLWLGARNLPVAPPRKSDLALYLTSVTCTRRNKSAAPEAARAYQFVAWLNGYESLSGDPCFRVPMEAAERAFSGPIKKSTPAEAWMIVAIIRGLAAGPLWKRVVAWAILACFMVLGRFSDLARLRWDDGYFEVYDWGVRFYLDMRKTDQVYAGQWIDIARSDSVSETFGGFTAVDELLRARAACDNISSVLRRVEGTGRRGERRLSKNSHFPRDHEDPSLAGRPKFMSRAVFQQYYQDFLVIYCGISLQEARGYTSHGIRAGAATSLVRREVPHHIIKARAGVKSDDWIATYDRIDLERRLECSRAIGL